MIELRRRYSGGVQSPSFSRLPKGYQEVEYLESTGTQYIKTGVIYNKDEIATIEIDCMLVQKNDIHNSCPYGFYRGSVSSSVSTEFSIDGALKISASALYDIIEQPVYESLKRHRMVVNGKDGTSINGSVLDSSIHKIIETTLEIPLFTRNPNGGNLTLEVFKGKIYCCKFYKDYKIIRDFVPCYRTTDRVAGMYDIVNDMFYTNAGIGEFLVGQDVHYNIPFEYQQVEWLKGDGNAYIKTNFIVNSEQEFEITFRIDDFSSIQMLLGISSPYYRLYSHSVGGTNQIEFQYQNNVWNQNIESGEKYIFKKVDSKYYLNNVELPIQLSNNFQSVQDFYIFSCNGELGRYESKNYIYSIKLHDRIFIPCYRREDNVAGMYDLVSGEFYPNAGTGTFEVGPEVIG